MGVIQKCNFLTTKTHLTSVNNKLHNHCNKCNQHTERMTIPFIWKVYIYIVYMLLNRFRQNCIILPRTELKSSANISYTVLLGFTFRALH